MQGAPDFLVISNLSKSFGQVSVVRDVSLVIRKGEFVSLLGPSGCGKTTTLRMIAGLMPADAGQIALDGERIDHVPSHHRSAAMVFQNYALFPHMTVTENVGFGLRMQKVPREEVRTRIAEVLELVRLGEFGGRYPRELSGGQQQRVALARAVVLKPKLLLLDEPLSNLDAKLRKELRSEFLDVHRIAGTTTILVTHDLEEAFALSDRVAVMHQGRVEQFDHPAQIFGKPASAAVAEFVGHSNVIAGVVERAADGQRVIRAGGPIVVRVSPDCRIGETHRIAIPAHVIDVRAEAGPYDNCIPVKINVASYLGAAVHYELEAGGLRLHAETHARSADKRFTRGDSGFACWRATDAIDLPMAR